MIAVSDAVRDFLVAKGLPEGRIDRIYNGVDNTAPISPESRIAAREALALPPDCIAVAMVGRMVAHKGHDLLLRALRELPDRGGAMQVLLIGDPIGEWPDALRGMAEELGVSSRVRMLGYQDDVKPLMRAMDVFVQPSRSEALSLSLLEAMSMGLPVIAARTGGMPEIVEHGHNGLLFSPNDAGDLARQLVRLTDASERHRLATAGRSHQAGNFTVHGMITATVSVYRQLPRYS